MRLTTHWIFIKHFSGMKDSFTAKKMKLEYNLRKYVNTFFVLR